MNYQNMTDKELLKTYQEIRADRKTLLDIESDIRREINTRHQLTLTPTRYDYKKKITLEQLKKLSKILPNDLLQQVLQIIENKEQQ